MRPSPVIPTHHEKPIWLVGGDHWYFVGGYGNAAMLGPLRVIWDSNMGWDHVSVSCETRTPTWAEMEFVKRSFFYPDETVMQLHVPEAEHVNCHPYCLHLWRPQGNYYIPRPPNWMVGGV